MTRARLERRFDAKIPRWSAQGVSGFIYKGGEKLLNFAVADERRSLSGSGLKFRVTHERGTQHWLGVFVITDASLTGCVDQNFTLDPGPAAESVVYAIRPDLQNRKENPFRQNAEISFDSFCVKFRMNG